MGNERRTLFVFVHAAIYTAFNLKVRVLGMNRTQVAYIQIQGWRSKIAEATVDGSTGNSSRTRTRLGHGVTAWIRTEPGRASEI